MLRIRRSVFASWASTWKRWPASRRTIMRLLLALKIRQRWTSPGRIFTVGLSAPLT